MQRIRRGIGRSAAGAIGIDLKTLAGELRGGKSIADVAGEHNVSVDDVKSAITADATKALDKARENGRIDQAKEDAALQKLSDSLDKIVNKKRTQPDPSRQSGNRQRRPEVASSAPQSSRTGSPLM